MNTITKWKSLLRFPIIKYLSVFLLIYCLYFIFSPTLLFANDRGATIRTLMLVLIFGIALYAVSLHAQKKLTYDKVLLGIILIGFILRIGYGIYTSAYTRQHDLGTGPNDIGHLGYIAYILRNFALPEHYLYQFYHPPLHPFLAAVIMKITEAWTQWMPQDWVEQNGIFFFSTKFEDAVQVVKVLTIFYSCMILLISKKILEEFNVSKTIMIIVMLLMAVHPTFIILAASINNDILAWMFFFVAFLYTIRWYKKPSYFHIIILAFAIGLGMMSKLSIALIAPIIAIVFILKWIQDCQNKQFIRLVPQFLVFAILCIPLGLGFPLRNYFELGQPLGFIAEVNNMVLYRGDSSFLDRFVWFPLDNLHGLFADLAKDYNLWIYILKTSVFGEFSYWQGLFFGIFLFFFNVILAPLSLFSMIYVFLKDDSKRYPFMKWTLAGIWIVLMASYIIFNIQYPFVCTMDFRYIVPTIFVGAVFLALFYEMPIVYSWQIHIKNVMKLSIAGFVIMSILFFATLV